MELRAYKPSKEVDHRADESEQWHDQNTDVEELKKGLYEGAEPEHLSEHCKKLKAESKKVWTADNTFMWQWEGINDKVKGLAKHRQPNLVTAGLAEQYHHLLSPPLTASCGHRCVHARAQMAEMSGRNANRIERYYGTYYGTEGTNFPEGITSQNVDEILRLISRENTGKMDCCRCYNARAWFGLKSSTTHDQVVFPGLTVGQLKESNGDIDISHLRMQRGQWYEIATGPAYYARIMDSRKLEGQLNLEHIGWHAGLMRPRFRFREFSTYNEWTLRRPQWWSNIRLADATAVISGLHSPHRFLCPNCLTAARGLPTHLYWIARGYSLKDARAKAKREQLAIQGRGKAGGRNSEAPRRWHKSATFDIKEWQKLGSLYA
jgi:hypothetical protein